MHGNFPTKSMRIFWFPVNWLWIMWNYNLSLFSYNLILFLATFVPPKQQNESFSNFLAKFRYNQNAYEKIYFSCFFSFASLTLRLWFWQFDCIGDGKWDQCTCLLVLIEHISQKVWSGYFCKGRGLIPFLLVQKWGLVHAWRGDLTLYWHDRSDYSWTSVYQRAVQCDSKNWLANWSLWSFCSAGLSFGGRGMTSLSIIISLWANSMVHYLCFCHQLSRHWTVLLSWWN